jgi:hypothetical protein
METPFRARAAERQQTPERPRNRMLLLEPLRNQQTAQRSIKVRNLETAERAVSKTVLLITPASLQRSEDWWLPHKEARALVVGILAHLDNRLLRFKMTQSRRSRQPNGLWTLRKRRMFYRFPRLSLSNDPI